MIGHRRPKKTMEEVLAQAEAPIELRLGLSAGATQAKPDPRAMAAAHVAKGEGVWS